MSGLAIVNMLIVLGIVVGGFVGLLLLALRKESQKDTSGAP